ncbi:hypothetical protein JGS22_002815 [Streptomyces sp. P38-E01]|uniref:Uncharacterized protein n=1 Tax=Streptomyces tardus TaxID=2780544 RepID=A0A949JDL2_9ACTN|nr:hypothetical protein [Streptomyces tardus]MBU7596595.1 hypothetical protein [Streptomyces tardus]
MTDVSEERRGSFLGVVERHWEKSGFEITGANSDREMPSIYAKTDQGYRLTLNIGYRGQAFFTIVSPCVRVSKLDPKLSKTNGPNFSGREIPRPPNFQDEFWAK